MSRIEQTFHKIADRVPSGTLSRLRAQAYEHLTRLPVPSKKQEIWKYTSPKGFLEASWDTSDSESKVDHLQGLPFYSIQSLATLVFVDGVLRENLSKNLNALSFTKYSSNLPEELVSRLSADTGDFFERLNLALLNDGLHVEIESEQKEPIVFLFVSTRSSDELATNSRLTFNVAPNCRATILELHHAPSSVSMASQVVSQVDLQKNSSVNYVKVQGSMSAKHLGLTQFTLAQDARVESTQVVLGGSLVRQNLQVRFEGEGSEAIVNGLYLGGGSEHIDNRTLIDHVVGNTTSQQLYKGILDGEARAVFTGGVKIQKDAQKANSSQLNNNLMLSQKAEIDTKPELEIEADDVKAAHGATIGQLDPDHVFYLQSRALSKKQAIEMLAYGFAQDIVDRISNDPIRRELSMLVKNKFSQFKVEE